MNERNLVDLLIHQALKQGDGVALRFKRDGKYNGITWKEFQCRVIQCSSALQTLGVLPGDRIAILSENRPEWAFSDLAILSLGATVVPIYATSSPKEVEYVLRNSECRIIFVSSDAQFERLASVLTALTNLKHVIVFDAFVSNQSKVVSLEHLIKTIDVNEARIKEFQNCVSRVKLDDLATIIYTSGTTGPPKGVMLTHHNFLINCHDAKKALPLSESDTFLSFLPLCHVFERMGGYYLSLLAGSTICYAENMNTVPENLLEVKPTIACAVPRFFEKTFSRIQSQIEAKGAIAKFLFGWAVGVGKRFNQLKRCHRVIPILLQIQRVLAQKLVYEKIYQRMGGKLRCFISGGAPLSKELAEFFYSVGILILEGYGLTETSPVISVNRWDKFKFGSVGLPVEHVEVRITDDDEIVVQGPLVMRGYYQDEAATNRVIQDGWFHTGDLGKIDPDGFIYITGRKKDIIVTSGGKNISPQNIENALLADPLFAQVVLVGDKYNFITALIVPNFDQLRIELKSKAVCLEGSPRDLIREKASHELIRQRIDQRTGEFASYETIKYFALLPNEFSQEKGEITLTLKIRRQTIAQHYANIIHRMYSETEKDDEARDRIFFVD